MATTNRVQNTTPEAVPASSRQPARLLRIGEVLARTGLKRTALYDLVRAGKFPKQTKLCEGSRSSFWIEAEVQDWIERVIASRAAQGGEVTALGGGARLKRLAPLRAPHDKQKVPGMETRS